MRVTQSMLADNSLNHLSKSFEKMGELQNQLSTGKKITRASQDPVIAMSGIRYRTEADEVQQFQRNAGEVNNWMNSTDSALDKSTEAMQRIKELTTQAANDSYEEGQRGNIAEEVSQLTDHITDVANTQMNGKYIFNGTDTTNAPVDEESIDINPDNLSDMDEAALSEHQVTKDGKSYAHVAGEDAVFESSDGEQIELQFSGTGEDDTLDSATLNGDEIGRSDFTVSRNDAVSTNQDDVEVELMKGVNIKANSTPQNTFSNELFGDLKQLEQKLRDPETGGDELSGYIETVDSHIDNIVNERAEVGARMNRVEMIESRMSEQEVTAEKIMSENEDADMEKVITELMSQENVHQAALSASSRIIQPSLMDFLR
ncbi:flagellar hook-associated protein 3 [Salibacterium salarium]|uniref:Flagellar hook-associated protein 3 n=1 Tax=Salibacterium salarium TaxID=284579 RepID=A0A3R9R8Z4_9BACI|nr:flagellar hook-associated protein FlgL [Salibacterium salarium]RSL29956.1 flagellar hook-associated protein 3 [Salibacterium salarium]